MENRPRLTAEVLSKLERQSKPKSSASAQLVAAMGSQTSQRVVSLPPLPRARDLSRQEKAPLQRREVPEMRARRALEQSGEVFSRPQGAPRTSAAVKAVPAVPRARPKLKRGAGVAVQGLDWSSPEAREGHLGDFLRSL